MKQFSFGMRSIFEEFFKNRKSEKNLKTYIPDLNISYKV